MKNIQLALAALLASVAFVGAIGSAQAETDSRHQAAARQAADTAGAEQFLRSIYAHYRDSDSDTTPPRDEHTYDAPLLALMSANIKAAGGELGYLDWDPLCDCQDYDITDVHIAFTAAGNDRLQAKVSMLNWAQHSTVDLLLHKTADGWRVADVSGQAGSLSAGLQRSTLELLAAQKKRPGDAP
jgi:hypothetical protein